MSKQDYYMRELANGWIHNSMRQDWRWCPRSFKYRYIEGERVPGSEVMNVGTSFHDFAKIYYNGYKIYELEEFNKLADLVAWQLAVIPDDAFPILKMFIERFIQFECRRYWYYARTLPEADEEFLPRYTELDLRHRLPGEKYGLAGTIDAVWCVHRGRNALVRLREYKVSRKGTRDPKFIGSVRGQLAFYQKLVDRHKLFGDDVTYRFELYNPLMDNGVFPLETNTFTRTRNGVYTNYWFMESPLSATETALDRSLTSFIEALEADYFPRLPKKDINYKCVYCPFYGLCWGSY